MTGYRKPHVYPPKKMSNWSSKFWQYKCMYSASHHRNEDKILLEPQLSNIPLESFPAVCLTPIGGWTIFMDFYVVSHKSLSAIQNLST